MPPCASGPVFTVSRPSRNGSGCATTGAGKRASVAAAPATLPANTVRRLTLRVFGLAGIRRPPFIPHLAGRRERASPAAGIVDAAHRRIGGYHWRGGSRCKGRYCRVFSTLPQRRIVARIDRMSEEFLLRPGPELADVFVSLDEL